MQTHAAFKLSRIPEEISNYYGVAYTASRNGQPRGVVVKTNANGWRVYVGPGYDPTQQEEIGLGYDTRAEALRALDLALVAPPAPAFVTGPTARTLAEKIAAQRAA